MNFTIFKNFKISLVIIIQHCKVWYILEIKCTGQYENVITLKDPCIFQQMENRRKLHTLLWDTIYQNKTGHKIAHHYAIYLISNMHD